MLAPFERNSLGARGKRHEGIPPAMGTSYRGFSEYNVQEHGYSSIGTKKLNTGDARSRFLLCLYPQTDWFGVTVGVASSSRLFSLAELERE